MARTKWFIAVLSAAWLASAPVVVAQEHEQAQSEEQAQRAKLDPTGTWKWERTFGDNTMHFTLRLKQQDGKLAGTLETTRGEEQIEPAEIEDAKLEGNKVAFAITRDFNGNEFTIDYEGTVEENAINGLTTLDFGGEAREFEWQAKRGLDWKDVLGEWQMASETRGGNVFEWTLTLTKEGEKVKGIVASEQFGEREISDVAIKDAMLTYTVVFERDGNEFSAKYTLNPRGDALKGSLQFGENAERRFEFTGERVKEKEAEAESGGEESQE